MVLNIITLVVDLSWLAAYGGHIDWGRKAAGMSIGSYDNAWIVSVIVKHWIPWVIQPSSRPSRLSLGNIIARIRHHNKQTKYFISIISLWCLMMARFDDWPSEFLSSTLFSFFALLVSVTFLFFASLVFGFLVLVLCCSLPKWRSWQRKRSPWALSILAQHFVYSLTSRPREGQKGKRDERSEREIERDKERREKARKEKTVTHTRALKRTKKYVKSTTYWI